MVSNNAFAVFTLCLLVLVTTTIAVGSRKTAKAHKLSEEETFIMQLFERYRQIILYGNKQYDVPVMDPYMIPDQQVDDDDPDGTMIKYNLTNMVARGLASFQTTHLRLDKEKLTLDLTWYVAKLTLDGHYEMNVFLNQKKFKFLHAYGKGAVNSAAHGIEVKCAFHCSTKTGFFQLISSKFELNYKKLGVNFQNLMGGGVKGAMMNTMINTLGKTAFNHEKKKILEEMQEDMNDELNEEFVKNNVKNLEDLRKHVDKNTIGHDAPPARLMITYPGYDKPSGNEGQKMIQYPGYDKPSGNEGQKMITYPGYDNPSGKSDHKTITDTKHRESSHTHTGHSHNAKH